VENPIMLPSTLFADVAPPVPGLDNPALWIGGGAALVLALFVCVVFLRRGKKKPHRNPEAGLAEDLATYPPAPPTHGEYTLRVMNLPARIRLVVVAPVGKKPIEDPEGLLDQVLYGLGAAARQDKPRVKIWPPQLSSEGFAPTFFRLTRKPEPAGKPSGWVLLAGPARAGAQPILLGLALYSETPNQLGLMTMRELQWNEVMRVMG
jgi:hypothetical protein